MRETGEGGRRGEGMETAASSVQHLIFPTVFGLLQAMESVTGSFLESWLQPVPGRRWPGSKALLPLTDPQASKTNKLGFPCHNITFPNP